MHTPSTSIVSRGDTSDLASDPEPALALVTQPVSDRRDLPPELRREPLPTSALASRQRGAQFPNLGLHRALLCKGRESRAPARGRQDGLQRGGTLDQRKAGPEACSAVQSQHRPHVGPSSSVLLTGG